MLGTIKPVAHASGYPTLCSEVTVNATAVGRINALRESGLENAVLLADLTEKALAAEDLGEITVAMMSTFVKP